MPSNPHDNKVIPNPIATELAVSSKIAVEIINAAPRISRNVINNTNQ